jgi:tetratricopeptide (TPR) repeat protein
MGHLSVTVCNFPTTSEAPLSLRKDPVSAEDKKPETQELELWDRIRTTEGAERAEVLDELSHFAYKKNNYTECLQLIDTSIEIYFSLDGDFHTKKLIHLYEGKAFCHSNLDQHAEAADAFNTLAGYFCVDEDREGFLRAKRAAGREYYSAENYQKSLECHTIVSKEIDIDATDYSMGIDNLNIGMAALKLEDFQSATEHLLIGRKHFKKAKNSEYVNYCDSYLADSYYELGQAIESEFHSRHYLNYTLVVEDLAMQAFARHNLAQALWLQKRYQEAEYEIARTLEILPQEESIDWQQLIKATHLYSAILFALGRDDEAKARLDRIATIEETMCDE